LVTGSLGGSILGKHFDFTPRVREALLLHEQFDLRAGIDVSDGLALDLSRLAQESGCGAELDLNAIPVSDAAIELSERSAAGGSPLEHALTDGEDFELVLAVPRGDADRILAAQPLSIGIRCIGSFVESPGLWSVAPDGRRNALSPRGYEHSFT
jgi:thiamine-monophosphate kinase